MRFSIIALTAFAGLSVAKRGCRHDPKNPGWGWYWVVQGDTLGDIGADFGQPYQQIAEMNHIPDPNSIPSWFTIVDELQFHHGFSTNK
ncbi:hypothetical protein E4U21_006664 [Claviceps maximensis]|nr:hypothetical protein E4U21_006664 [Claviceps maximensis]